MHQRLEAKYGPGKLESFKYKVNRHPPGQHFTMKRFEYVTKLKDCHSPHLPYSALGQLTFYCICVIARLST